MADIVSIMGGAFTPPKAPQPDQPEVQLARAMEAAGIRPPANIQIDGKLHRFDSFTKGKPGHDKSGYYVAFPDGIPAGRFGCWRAGIEQTWRADIGRELSVPEQMAHAKRLAEAIKLRDAAQAKMRETIADVAETIWAGLDAAPDWHPYLVRKGIQPHGARVTGDGRLALPMYDPDGSLVSLQYIDNEGGKLYHASGRATEAQWLVGDDNGGTIYIAEGFATAATIAEETGQACAIAYSASNLPNVARALREKRGNLADIVIVADHDKGGVGFKYADQAAAKYGVRVVRVPIEDMDANDYRAAGHDLLALLAPTGTDAIERLKIVFGDQLGTESEVPDELIEDMLVCGKMAVIYGDSNSGKTFFALSLAAAIATGKECYGKQVEPGLVIYLATEAPGSIRTRMQALKRYYGCDLADLAMVPVPLNFYNGDADAVAVIEAIREIENIKGKKVRAVIGDTLARMSAGANENSGEDMGPVMARFEQICIATGAAMIIIHHNGKDAARGARGWSGIRAAIDTEIEVVEKDGRRSATFTKQRELPSKGQAVYFKLEVIPMGETKFGKPATTCVAIPDDEAEAEVPNAVNKTSPHYSAMRMLERAWFATQCEKREGFPYVTESGVRHYMATGLGMKERAIKNALDRNNMASPIASLMMAELIKPHEHGWIIVDEGSTGAFSILSKTTLANPGEL